MTKTNNNLTNNEMVRDYILSVLPEVKNELFSIPENISVEDSNNKVIQNFVSKFDSISFKGNEKALNVLYAYDTLVAYNDCLKKDIENFSRKIAKEYRALNESNDSMIQESVIDYEVNELVNAIILKGKKAVNKTGTLSSKISSIIFNIKENELEKAIEQLKELLSIEFTIEQLEAIQIAMINANNKELTVKGNGTVKNILLSVLRNKAKKQGFYKPKTVKVKIADAMKECSFILESEFKKLDSDLGVKILAETYKIKVGEGSKFDYTKDRKKVERELNKKIVISENLLSVIEKLSMTEKNS